VNAEARAAGLEKPALEPFEFYCWRHTCGTRWAESGMDKFTVARYMGHSSPGVAERYYIHVTEPHVTSGFERFVTYQERQIVDSLPAASDSVQ
jgi:integrase